MKNCADFLVQQIRKKQKSAALLFKKNTFTNNGMLTVQLFAKCQQCWTQGC